MSEEAERKLHFRSYFLNQLEELEDKNGPERKLTLLNCKFNKVASGNAISA
jgi:hypothetical protein